MASYTTITVDKYGRIVIPKRVRDKMGLKPGATLDLTVRGNEIVLKPRDNGARKEG